MTIRDWGELATGRRLEVSKQRQAKPLGRLLCYSGIDWSALEWTDTRVDVFAVAFGRDPARLYRWWLTRGGPLPEPTG